ncbi:hypothetical protein GYB22_04385 [bacterium]|nr:hypothetical protein [bacterium]
MDVKIAYLSFKGRSDMKDVVDMFSKDVGPITFQLLDYTNYSKYYLVHRGLKKIDPENFRNLSALIREEVGLKVEDVLVIVTPRDLITPYPVERSFKNWLSYYDENNIVIRSSGYHEVTEGRPYLGVAHQVIENIFQNLGGINLAQIGHTDGIHLGRESCINDFSEELNDVKGKMWSGRICAKCLAKAKENIDNATLQQIRSILRRISNRLNDNYEINCTPEELKIEVTLERDPRKVKARPRCLVTIGGRKINFGRGDELRTVRYVFYLINHNLPIGKYDFIGDGVYNDAAEKYKLLYDKIQGSVTSKTLGDYIDNLPKLHDRISNRILNEVQNEYIGNLYSLKSLKTNKTDTCYIVNVEPDNIDIPDELMEFRVG